MKVEGIDHIVLCVADVQATIEFYHRLLGLEPREERPGKWSLHFGPNKISLQDAAASPEIARDTAPGSSNFCLLTSTPKSEIVARLDSERVPIPESATRRPNGNARLTYGFSGGRGI